VQNSQPLPEAGSNKHAGKYLTFQVGDENYGIPVLRTREIIRLPKITPVPQMPAHVRGIINLRGRIIPVVDLRTRFGLPAATDHARTCIVVVHLRLAERGEVAMGLVVDAVEEVANLTAADIEPTPEFATGQDTGHIVGMAKIKGVVKTLLDLDRLLAA
jgi:purine-binding chemotaxis protein CheW